MMMPHTTGTMNGRTIWKHQATSRATKPMRIAASTALRTKIRSVRDPGRVVTLQFLAEDYGCGSDNAIMRTASAITRLAQRRMRGRSQLWSPSNGHRPSRGRRDADPGAGAPVETVGRQASVSIGSKGGRSGTHPLDDFVDHSLHPALLAPNIVWPNLEGGQASGDRARGRSGAQECTGFQCPPLFGRQTRPRRAPFCVEGSPPPRWSR